MPALHALRQLLRQLPLMPNIIKAIETTATAPRIYGYSGYGVNANVAAQQCTAAVQSRLASRTSLGSILGSLVGIPTEC